MGSKNKIDPFFEWLYREILINKFSASELYVNIGGTNTVHIPVQQYIDQWKRNAKANASNI